MQRWGAAGLGVGCGEPGDLLAWADESSIGFAWDPYAVTMTPGGRVFVAEFVGARRTYELTPNLVYVTRFHSPTVAEFAIPFTVGVTSNEDTGTLWWTNAEVDGFDIRRILLLEGTLEGVATGRRIEIPIPPGPPPSNSGYPKGASYDPATRRYYYVDRVHDNLWAIDTLGVVELGFPRSLDAYPTAFIGNAVDAFGGATGGPEGTRLEIPVGLVIGNDYDRVVVTDSAGTNMATETSMLSIWARGWYPTGSTARSRLDPNGVMYVPFSGGGPGEPDGVAAIRPVPLSPTWLSLADWSGTIPAGGTAEVTLTFRAGQRAPGEYRSTLVVEDTAGVVLASVPLTLVVEAGTPAEPAPEEAGVALAVSPNPVAGAAAVTLTLPAAASAARVAVFDVLGREVVALHEGSLPAGATRLALDAGALPAGLYVVRVVSGDQASSAQFSVAR
jgi:hypothetical protein